MRVYPRENTTVIEVPKLEDQSGNVVADAQLIATVRLADGLALEEVPDPVVFVGDGTGRYTATIPPLFLPDGEQIEVKVSATSADVMNTWTDLFVMRDRKLSPSPADRCDR